MAGFWKSSKTKKPMEAASRRLHVGCGRERLEGWVNIDLQELPGVDVVADATRDLGFRDAEAVYAEHFLEHLRIDQAVAFLREAHRALAADGLLRLSTPNLDWVWTTHYNAEAFAEVKTEMAIQINLAFHGWEHQFLWNRELLGEVLESCGFTDLAWCRYGESGHELFEGIERHPASADTEGLPHVLIVEAVKGEPEAERLAALDWRIQRGFLDHLKG